MNVVYRKVVSLSMAKTFKEKFRCFNCDKEYVETNYYKSYSNFYSSIGKIPYCKHCIEKLYQYYYDKYMNGGCLNAEQEAVKRICMAFDIYYNAKAFNDAINSAKKRQTNISPMASYMKMIQLSQFKGKSYDTTIEEMAKEEREFVISGYSGVSDENNVEVDEDTIRFFGKGFDPEDYAFLKEQYQDWITRHECKTKAQEEVFKRICFKQLEILKATRLGEDTKNLDDTFQRLLDTAKLQPKQNSGDAMSDAQTFGTLIDKWENTRPIPEVEEELKDVDKIGLLIHTFYTGHMAKVLNLPSSLTALYDKFMKKYTVEKQEYSSDSDNEALFNSIFGKKNIDEQDAYTEE